MFKRKLKIEYKKNRSSLKLDYSKFNNVVEFANDNNIKSESEYIIITSLNDKLTYVLSNINDKWEILYKWSCTVGKASTPSPKGVFKVGIKYKALGDEEVSVRYAINIFEDYYYHSILYDPTDEYIKDDRLGYEISHGCIRLATDNAKWLFENVPQGSTIIIK